ncbi:MAG: DsbA family protein [Novosphingobium sp.]
MTEPVPSRAPALKPLLLLGLPLLAIGGAIGWFGHAAAPLTNRAAVETVVREYILAHPEILPEAMERLRRGQDRAQLRGIRAQVEAPFPGAVLGNPAGKFTLVEFVDFACGYCRRSVADVDALIAADSELRVVIRELPILSPQSADAARWALAAAEQGRYAAFHKAMFASGRPSAETIAAAAKAAGLDLARARTVIAAPGTEAELSRNLGFARTLGFEGTPSWIAGEEVLSGAVGRERLAKALQRAAG